MFYWTCMHVIRCLKYSLYQHEYHYCDVIISAMASQITGVSIACRAVCSGSSKKTSKLCVTGLCDGSPPQKANNAKMFPFDDVVMIFCDVIFYYNHIEQLQHQLQQQPHIAITTITNTQTTAKSNLSSATSLSEQHMTKIWVYEAKLIIISLPCSSLT